MTYPILRVIRDVVDNPAPRDWNEALPAMEINTNIADAKGRRQGPGAAPLPVTTVLRTVVTDPKQEKYWRGQNRAASAQVVIAFIAVVAVILAGLVALTNYLSSRNDARASLRQSQESQLSAAIDALGAPGSVGERIAGLLLLTSNTEGRFTQASQSGELPANIYNDYTTALQILSGYLSSRSQDLLNSIPYATFHRGYGIPARTDATSLSEQAIDLYYAADQVRELLSVELKKQVDALHGPEPAIDLSNDELYGVSWTGVNFSWVHAYMPGIDLRDADLAGALFQGATLAGAHLQCADLTGANFQGAHLGNVQLFGANVQGADFRGAHIYFSPGQTTVVYGHAHWSHGPPKGLVVDPAPAAGWSQVFCQARYIVPELAAK